MHTMTTTRRHPRPLAKLGANMTARDWYDANPRCSSHGGLRPPAWLEQRTDWTARTCQWDYHCITSTNHRNPIALYAIGRPHPNA